MRGLNEPPVWAALVVIAIAVFAVWGLCKLIVLFLGAT